MKTAFRYLLERDIPTQGVVTVDGDGQHKASDVLSCAKAMLETRGVVLGVRNFDLPDVPPRSRMGNKITSLVFRLFCGIKISDTQTGLRAIPAAYLPAMLEVSGDRYEYETNMLLDFGMNNIPFTEVEIQTVYIDENATSHFDPIRDSIRIYKQILKYILSSVGSFLIDIGLFFILKLLFSSITLCTVIARIASSVFNYTFNKKLVFGSKGSTAKSLIKYYALCIPQMLVSAGLVTLMSNVMSANAAWIVTLIKLFIDTVLFVCSYIIQKKWVFKN
jgi:putative flippase GtrA